MTRRARTLSLYAQTGRVYWAWTRLLLPLAVIIFVPLGLVHAATIHADIGTLDPSQGFKLLATAAALLALTTTGLLGEILYAGAVAIALTHPHQGNPPSLREVVGMVNYRRLIAIDLIYDLLVSIGFVFLIVPGVLAFLYLGLAAPVVEIEGHGIWAAFKRSVGLVRGSLVVAAALIVPIEVVGDALTRLATGLVQQVFGSSLLGDWIADSLSNIALTPFYAIAAVLLALELIAKKDGNNPGLHAGPPGR